MSNILSLGQTLGYSNRLQQFVSCFAGMDLLSGNLIRILGCELDLPCGGEFTMSIVRDTKDDRPESYRLKSQKVELVEMHHQSILLDIARNNAFDSFEDAIDSGESLAFVRLRSFDYTFARGYKSVLDMHDMHDDRLMLRFLAINASSKLLPTTWQVRADNDAIVLLGNKKINRDWIAINVFGSKFKPPFDKQKYQRELMRDRRS